MASRKICKYPLPVHVEDDVLEANPKFCQLLHVLCTKLTPDGVSIDKKRELEIVQKNNRLSRQGWLMNRILYEELRELVTDLELRSIEGSLSLEEEQLTEVLSQAVAFSELPDYLPLPSTPSQSHNLFGMSVEDLDRHNPTKLHIPAIQKAVLPLLEDRLMKKYQGLRDFFTPDMDSSNAFESQEDFSLPRLVEEKKQQLSREKTSLQNVERRRRDSFLMYYQLLLECLSSMERIVSFHKMEVQAVSDKVTLDWMEAWCVANSTKAKLTLLQLDCDTYPPQTVAALKRIRSLLDKAIRESQRELAKATEQVNTYRAVGAEFKFLVDEYTKLKKEIDDCTWGLQHFGAKGDSKD